MLAGNFRNSDLQCRKERVMKKIILAIIMLTLSVPVFAGDKNKDWKIGRVVKVQVQDMQSADYKGSNNTAGAGKEALDPGASTGGPTGGSFSSAPAHFNRYNVLFETESEAMILSMSKEISFRQPDLKQDAELKYKMQGSNAIEIIDSSGRKTDFKVVKHLPKEGNWKPTEEKPIAETK
jgi:hypothetical protein